MARLPDVEVWVINLDRSRERRASMQAQLDGSGVHHAFFRALEGKEAYAMFDAYDERRFRINTGRVASPAEVGCYASHVALWRRAVASNQPSIVMEDDAAVGAGFAAAVTHVERVIETYGFVRMQTEGPHRNVRKMEVERSGSYGIHYCMRYPYGSMCYAIAPRVAAAFVPASRVFAAPVDLFIKMFWIHGQPLYALCPYPVTFSELRENSTIAARDERDANLGLKVQRLAHKLASSVRRARFNHAHVRWVREHRRVP